MFYSIVKGNDAIILSPRFIGFLRLSDSFLNSTGQALVFLDQIAGVAVVVFGLVGLDVLVVRS